MASAQVMPSSRKQELAEAGRRKLEQFRKQKAAERARKASANNRAEPVDGATGNPGITGSVGAVTSNFNGPVDIIPGTSKVNEFSQENAQVSSNESHSNSSSSKNTAQKDSGDQDIQKGDTSGLVRAGSYSSLELKNSKDNLSIYNRPEGVILGGSIPNYFSGIDKQASQSYDSGSTESSFYGVEDSFSNERESFSKVFPRTFGSVGQGHGLTSSYEDSLHPRMTGSVLEAGSSEQSNVEFKEIKVSDPKGQKQSASTSSLFGLQDTSIQSSESLGFGLDGRSSLPFYSAKNETSARRSRPSFLDSLNIPRASTEIHDEHAQGEKGSVTSSSSLLDVTENLGSATFQRSFAKGDSIEPFSTLGASNARNHSGVSLVSVSNGAVLGYNDFPPPKQNEDFAALEQHIEDLTQEKFSLQRALEVSRALAESLASENSSLTDSYNQQRSVVNQLKADMEKLQEEIQAQMAELEAFRNEYANARLECNAADERAKILASEVIGLEEKALRLRSNELKLERELEDAQAKMSSYKKKMSSLETERQDLQSTINALHEEKVVLQSKLWKASSGAKTTDTSKSLSSRKDMSTSTEDLDSIPENSNQEMHSTALLERDVSILSMLPETGQSALEVLSVNIPADQMRMVENINTLISELAMEKEELVQALSTELSQSTKLKELNQELSSKLEAQTQRLELLTAQSMASDRISSRGQPDSHVVEDHTPYADEGDEVVERVLGWIMKLFPGGPSRRRTSKLL